MNYKKIAKEAIKQVFDLLQTRRLQLVNITNAGTLGTDANGNVISTSSGGYIELTESIDITLAHIGKTFIVPATTTGQSIYITIDEPVDVLIPVGAKIKVIILNSTNSVQFNDGNFQTRGGFVPGINNESGVSMTAEKISETMWLVESPYLYSTP